MKKFCALVVLACASSLSFAQVGRAELQIDSIPIGGKTQERGERQMEAHDEVRNQLVSLRDSVTQALSDKSSSKYHAVLKSHRQELDKLIQTLSRSDRDEKAIASGYSAMDRVRKTLRGVHHAPKSGSNP